MYFFNSNTFKFYKNELTHQAKIYKVKKNAYVRETKTPSG